jgi:threonine/homoserine/homoserine lactone efflux protein
VLNPKVALFFLAFIPQFVDASRGSVELQFAVLGTMFDTSSTIVNVLVALAAGSIRSFLGRSPRASRIQQWFTGGVFVALGARLALVARQ